MTDLISLLLSCDTCDEYAGRRLPAVVRLWWTETGNRPNAGHFMRGVHARHLAGLPIGAEQ